MFCFFFSSRRRHTRYIGDWSSDVCSSDLVWFYEDRLKLFAIVLVVYAFLLHLLGESHTDLLKTILRLKCHRTGKRYKIGRASCRERVEIQEGDGTIKKKSEERPTRAWNTT